MVAHDHQRAAGPDPEVEMRGQPKRERRRARSPALDARREAKRPRRPVGTGPSLGRSRVSGGISLGLPLLVVGAVLFISLDSIAARIVAVAMVVVGLQLLVANPRL